MMGPTMEGWTKVLGEHSGESTWLSLWRWEQVQPHDLWDPLQVKNAQPL